MWVSLSLSLSLSLFQRWSVPADAAEARAEGYGRMAVVRTWEEASQLLVNLGAEPTTPEAEPELLAEPLAENGLGLVRAAPQR